MDWPEFEGIDTESALWSLATSAVREIQSLSFNGEAGYQAAESTTKDGLAQLLKTLGKKMLPMDLQAFFRYHHGGKVNTQDHMLLQAFISSGEAEGKPSVALEKLLYCVEHKETDLDENLSHI